MIDTVIQIVIQPSHSAINAAINLSRQEFQLFYNFIDTNEIVIQNESALNHIKIEKS